MSAQIIKFPVSQTIQPAFQPVPASTPPAPSKPRQWRSSKAQVWYDQLELMDVEIPVREAEYRRLAGMLAQAEAGADQFTPDQLAQLAVSRAQLNSYRVQLEQLRRKRDQHQQGLIDRERGKIVWAVIGLFILALMIFG